MTLNLTEVDWAALPIPEDDGAANHLKDALMPSIGLPATHGESVDFSMQAGRCVIYIYPKTGRPDQPLPDGWDSIPGARGCTPQSCAFRDHAAALSALGVTALFGLSTQDSAYQAEAATRLHLPFPLVSDADRRLAKALSLPTFDVEGETLLKRITLVLRAGRIEKVFYPVFPPDRSADDVMEWLRTEAQRR